MKDPKPPFSARSTPSLRNKDRIISPEGDTPIPYIIPPKPARKGRKGIL